MACSVDSPLSTEDSLFVDIFGHRLLLGPDDGGEAGGTVRVPGQTQGTPPTLRGCRGIMDSKHMDTPPLVNVWQGHAFAKFCRTKGMLALFFAPCKSSDLLHQSATFSQILQFLLHVDNSGLKNCTFLPLYLEYLYFVTKRRTFSDMLW